MAGDSSRHNGKKGGRPKGSTTRPQLRDFYDDTELKEFIDDLKLSAKTDPTMKKFVAEQLFGKAAQQLEIGGIDGEPLEARSAVPTGNLIRLASSGESGDVRAR